MTILLAGYLRALLSCSFLLVFAGHVVAANTTVTVDQRVRGNLDATVTMIEYSDFTCGFCLKFFKETWPRIQSRYVETGKVRFLYKDYPRADQGPGLAAAVAARCAGDQGAYWPMHDRLFAEGARLDQKLFLHTDALEKAGCEKVFSDTASGSLDTSRWDAFTARMWRDGVLTKADYEYAQAVWDHPPLQEWVAAARNERWKIPKYDQ